MFEINAEVLPIPLDVVKGVSADTTLGSPKGEFFGTDEDMQALAINGLTNIALESLRSRVDAAYLVRWASDFRTPMGVVIGSRVIAATRHGMVYSPDGEHFGLYERIKEAQSPDDQNEMLVLVFAEEPESK